MSKKTAWDIYPTAKDADTANEDSTRRWLETLTFPSTEDEAIAYCTLAHRLHKHFPAVLAKEISAKAQTGDEDRGAVYKPF